MESSMKATTNTPTLTDIKAKVPVDIALAHYGVTLKQQAARLVGCCPIHHGSNNRAFVVSPDRRTWYCFGDCARGGSVLDLAMALEDCSLSEAARILAERHQVKDC
jgi:DNA primase